MAIFKCKMCGGTLDINNETVIECEYCGTQQTLPKLDDDRRANLYDRANHFRRNNEFDKAEGIYEQILNEDNTDAEAYWSLVLCRYGIEYVEDPASHKRIPTVNRAQYTAIYDDDNYKSALQYADTYQKAIYESEAKVINEIQKGILEISKKEDPFDVFICYKETDNNGRRTPDSVLANDLYHQLIQEGFKVFFARITLEDKLGSAYEPYIFAALNSAKVMVVLGTKPDFFNAVWVKNEWSRYLSLIKNGAKKMLIPAYKDMDPYDLPEEFSHLQAQDMTKLGFMQDLIRGIKKITQVNDTKATIVKETVVSAGGANTEALLKRTFMFLEDGDWNLANEYVEKVLDIDPENALAYLAKLMVELRIKKQNELRNQSEPFDDRNNYQKAIRFADENLKRELQGYVDAIKDRILNANSIVDYAKKLIADLRVARQQESEQQTKKQTVLSQVEMLNQQLVQLSSLRDEFPEIEREMHSIKEKLNQTQNEIDALNKELNSLGFFAGKQKKEIQQTIAYKVNSISELHQRRTVLEGKKGSYQSIEKVIGDINAIQNNIEIQNNRLSDLTGELTSDRIIAELKQTEVGQELLEKYELFGDKEVGDVILFGRYPQIDVTASREDKIEWFILEKRDQQVLVISKYALDCLPYNEENIDTTWEKCTLRQWLNDDFLNNAFSEKGKKMIPIVKVSADRNPEYNTKPGNATQDRVFLLSADEAIQYLDTDNEIRENIPTAYTIGNGVFMTYDGSCYCWLRTPGSYQYCAAIISGIGYISDSEVDSDSNAVRPALWIDLDA